MKKVTIWTRTLWKVISTPELAGCNVNTHEECNTDTQEEDGSAGVWEDNSTDLQEDDTSTGLQDDMPPPSTSLHTRCKPPKLMRESEFIPSKRAWRGKTSGKYNIVVL